MIESFPEDNITVVLETFLKLLLQESAAMLVLAHAGDFSNEILESVTSKPVIYSS